MDISVSSDISTVRRVSFVPLEVPPRKSNYESRYRRVPAAETSVTYCQKGRGGNGHRTVTVQRGARIVPCRPEGRVADAHECPRKDDMETTFQ